MPLSTIPAAGLSTGVPTRAQMPAGSVLQVIQTVKANSFVGTSVPDNGGYFIDVTGMSVSITPISTTSKILILTNLYQGVTTVNSGYQQSYRLKRVIGGVTTFPILGDAEGGRPRTTGRVSMYGTNQFFMIMNGGVHQDSPNTALAITYHVQVGGYSGSPIVYINRAENFQVLADNYDTVPVSTITLMEIAG